MDGRGIDTGEAQWWVLLRQRWLELRRCDHAIAFHEPRMFELNSHGRRRRPSLGSGSRETGEMTSAVSAVLQT